MKLEDAIYERKSCRKYSDELIDDDEFRQIEEFITNAKTLNDTKFHYEILKKDKMSIKTRWSAPYYFAFYSQKSDNYMENIGFVFQQLSLFLHTLGIGTCWVGLASPKVKSDDFVISMSFGKSKDISRDLSKFKRKDISKFSDYPDDKLKPAYFAPSAMNSQPWYFKHTDDAFDLYQIRANFLKRKILDRWNPIDVGICLAHLYVANKDTFNFKIKTRPDKLKGRIYIGTVKV